MTSYAGVQYTNSLTQQELRALARARSITVDVLHRELSESLSRLKVADLKLTAHAINNWSRAYKQAGYKVPYTKTTGLKAEIQNAVLATLSELFCTKVSREGAFTSGRLSLPVENAASRATSHVPSYQPNYGYVGTSSMAAAYGGPRDILGLSGTGTTDASKHSHARSPFQGGSALSTPESRLAAMVRMDKLGSLSGKVPSAPSAPLSGRMGSNTMYIQLSKSTSYSRRANNPYFPLENIVDVFRLSNSASCRFNVDNIMIGKLKKRTHKLLVRLYDTIQKRDLPWLPMFVPSLNRVNVFVPNPAKRLKKAKFATPPALNIGSMCQFGQNMLSASVTGEEYRNAVVCIQMSRVAQEKELVGKVPPIDKDELRPVKHDGDSDGEVAEEFQIVRITCGLSLGRINIPATGVSCKHAECFDLTTYLEYCRNQHIWQCPTCNNELPFSDLRVDTRFQRILMDPRVSSGSEVEFIRLRPDMTFEPYDPDAERAAPPRKLARQATSQDVGDAAAQARSSAQTRVPVEDYCGLDIGSILSGMQPTDNVPSAPQAAPVPAATVDLSPVNPPQVGQTFENAIELDSD